MAVLFQFLLGLFWEFWPFKIIFPWERGLLIIAGRWVYEMTPGIWVRVPLIMQWEDDIVTEEPCDLPHQYLQTSDNAVVGISGRLTYTIEDMKTLYLTVHDHEEWLTTIAMGHLSNWMQQATWEEIDADDIADQLLPELKTDALEKGLGVVRLEITHLAELEAHYLVHDGIGGEELGE